MKLLRSLVPRSSAGSPVPAWRWMLAGLALSLAAGVSQAAWEGHHGPGGDGGGPMMAASPERMGRMVDRLLDEAGASQAQRSQVQQIMQAAAADLKPQHEAGRALRDQQMGLFAQPTVDAVAVEQLRQKMLAHHDQVSRRMTQALLDISRVLTPEQRAKLAERMKARGDGPRRQRPVRPERPESDRPKP